MGKRAYNNVSARRPTDLTKLPGRLIQIKPEDMERFVDEMRKANLTSDFNSMPNRMPNISAIEVIGQELYIIRQNQQEPIKHKNCKAKKNYRPSYTIEHYKGAEKFSDFTAILIVNRNNPKEAFCFDERSKIFGDEEKNIQAKYILRMMAEFVGYVFLYDFHVRYDDSSKIRQIDLTFLDSMGQYSA